MKWEKPLFLKIKIQYFEEKVDIINLLFSEQK